MNVYFRWRFSFVFKKSPCDGMSKCSCKGSNSRKVDNKINIIIHEEGGGEYIVVLGPSRIIKEGLIVRREEGEIKFVLGLWVSC